MKIDEIQAKLVSAGNLDEIVPRKLATILADLYEKIENQEKSLTLLKARVFTQSVGKTDEPVVKENLTTEDYLLKEDKEEELIDKHSAYLANYTGIGQKDAEVTLTNFLNEYKKLK